MAGMLSDARASAAAARVCVPALLLLCPLWAAGPAAAGSALERVQGRCEIRFVGSSTLHDFSGVVSSRPFALERHVDASSGREWWSGAVEVAVAEMHTGIGRRDRNMRAMFEVDRFPVIVADFTRVETAALANLRSGGEAKLDFSLAIRDVKRLVEARVSHWVEEGDRASFDADFEVSLKSFGLAVPPVLGLLRVGDVVSVHAHANLEAPPGSQGAARPSRPPEAPVPGS